MTEDSPALHYINLGDLINFEEIGFDYSNWVVEEVEKLNPQLESMGYTNIQWRPGETDSWGPLTRICRTVNPRGDVVWFIYG